MSGSACTAAAVSRVAVAAVERLTCPDGAWWVGFFSADWTPWPVVAMWRARWPALGFRLRVVYAAG